MSIKRFCDCCGDPTSSAFVETGFKGEVILNERRKVLLRIEIEIGGTNEGEGDICATCLSRALYGVAPVPSAIQLDVEAAPRPRRAKASAA